MKRGMIAFFTALGMAALVAGGCANKEVVKSEDQSAATVKQQQAPKTEPARPAPSKTETTEPTPVPQPPKAEESAQGAKATAAATAFQTIYFDFDKSDLRQDARDLLNKNAEVMMKNSNLKVRIEGHCDERGSAEYNLALGERRAKSVQQYLTTLGVAADRLTVISYGKEKPAVEGNNEAAFSKNRRAEFFIVK